MSQDHNIPCSPALIRCCSSPLIEILGFTLPRHFKAVHCGDATKHTKETTCSKEALQIKSSMVHLLICCLSEEYAMCQPDPCSHPWAKGRWE